MTLARYALTLALGLSSVGITSAQEHPPMPTGPTSPQALAILTERAEFFEAKAKLATQSAKGLRLVQNVMKLTTPDDDGEETQWTHETYLLLSMWFSAEQRDEWYLAGKEFGSDFETYLKGVPTKEEALERYKEMFAQIMNAQVTVLEKLSNDLDARMNRLQEPRSSD